MFDAYGSYTLDPCPMNFHIVKPNRITGEGRMKIRGHNKTRDMKKHQRRKMAKQSKRRNR